MGGFGAIQLGCWAPEARFPALGFGVVVQDLDFDFSGFRLYSMPSGSVSWALWPRSVGVSPEAGAFHCGLTLTPKNTLCDSR